MNLDTKLGSIQCSQRTRTLRTFFAAPQSCHRQDILSTGPCSLLFYIRQTQEPQELPEVSRSSRAWSLMRTVSLSAVLQLWIRLFPNAYVLSYDFCNCECFCSEISLFDFVTPLLPGNLATSQQQEFPEDGLLISRTFQFLLSRIKMGCRVAMISKDIKGFLI